MKMENNLSKTISQIITKWCEGATDNIADGVLYHHAAEEIAEMINGLDGRGNLQEGWISVEERRPPSLLNVLVCYEVEGQDFWTRGYLFGDTWAVMLWEGKKEVPITWIKKWMPLPAPPNSKPDRQVKSAEEILNETIEGYNATANNVAKFQFNKRETKLFTDMMDIYAQQYK